MSEKRNLTIIEAGVQLKKFMIFILMRNFEERLSKLLQLWSRTIETIVKIRTANKLSCITSKKKTI